MKLVKVTGTMTVEAYSVETARQFILRNDATGDAQVEVEEIGNAPVWQSWRVTEEQAAQINALLGLDKVEAPTIEEVPAA